MNVTKENREFIKRKLFDYGYYTNKINECERKLIDVRESINDCCFVHGVRYDKPKNEKNVNHSRIHDLVMEEGELLDQLKKYENERYSLGLDNILESLNDELKELVNLYFIKGYSHNYITTKKQYDYVELVKRKINKALKIIINAYEF